MEPRIWQALVQGLTCDITTIGRRSGRPVRIEIWYFVIDGIVYISGTPGPRDWYANILANPSMWFHVKEGTRADLPATAVPITAPHQRRQIMARIKAANSYFGGNDLEAWVASSPLIQVVFTADGQ